MWGLNYMQLRPSSHQTDLLLAACAQWKLSHLHVSPLVFWFVEPNKRGPSLLNIHQLKKKGHLGQNKLKMADKCHISLKSTSWPSWYFPLEGLWRQLDRHWLHSYSFTTLQWLLRNCESSNWKILIYYPFSRKIRTTVTTQNMCNRSKLKETDLLRVFSALQIWL